jgi:hypothetical protein
LSKRSRSIKSTEKTTLMLETNPQQTSLKDLFGRVDILRGYL